MLGGKKITVFVSYAKEEMKKTLRKREMASERMLREEGWKDDEGE